MAKRIRKSDREHGSVQRGRVRCECGALALVTPTKSPWEFETKCTCGRGHRISWAHADPPPIFRDQRELQFKD